MKVVVSVNYELEVPDHMSVDAICDHVLNSGVNLWSRRDGIVWDDTQITNVQLNYAYNVQLNYAYPETRE